MNLVLSRRCGLSLKVLWLRIRRGRGRARASTRVVIMRERKERKGVRREEEGSGGER